MMRAVVRSPNRATTGSSAFRMATPSSGSASTSSALARATVSRDPNISRCAAPTFVRTPTVGRAERHSISMWPSPRLPISSTSASVPSGALRIVSGTPTSVLNERGLACTRNREASTARDRSLVVVLPVEPVIPTTGPSKEVRSAAASAIRASPTFVTRTTGPLHPSPREIIAPAAPASNEASMKLWPS
jgi:hypothetical protein